MEDRRKFIKHLGLLASASTLIGCGSFPKLKRASVSRLKNLKKPLAINMWDYSWLLRTHKNGGFENWDTVLDELVERGYNALRIDAFPHLIASNDAGERQEIYHIKKNKWPALWGNLDAVSIHPREALITFLNKCFDRNIEVGLSTWFSSHSTSRNTSFSGISGLVRAWDETLQWIDSNNLLEQVLYVDILNEYPLWHGYTWLKEELKKLDDNPSKKGERWDFLNEKGKKKYNQKQIEFYNKFISEVIVDLKSKYKNLDFFSSQTNTLNTPWQDLDVKNFDALDIHIWMIYNYKFSKETEYFDKIHILGNDEQLESCQSKISSYWNNHKEDLIHWLDIELSKRKTLADQLNIPLGNTEGWGPVMWMDHPKLNWSFVKDSGIIGAELGQKHGFSFNCSSNFNHPHFKGIWNDIEWHKKVTSIIKGT